MDEGKIDSPFFKPVHMDCLAPTHDAAIARMEALRIRMAEVESGSPFIKRLRAEYQAALSGIETTVPELISANKEMRAILTFSFYCGKILEIHELLTTYYRLIHNNVALLDKYQSIRLLQWGHNLEPTVKLIEGTHVDEEWKERDVLGRMRGQGYNHEHRDLRERLLVEIDYMLDVLDVLIEPDFMPIAESVDSDGEPGRHIPSEVKLNVWRRDSAKCVKCGSQERLEYDHIIPVSKGGSNTERNVQLLCEKCNREKAAQIQ